MIRGYDIGHGRRWRIAGAVERVKNRLSMIDERMVKDDYMSQLSGLCTRYFPIPEMTEESLAKLTVDVESMSTDLGNLDIALGGSGALPQLLHQLEEGKPMLHASLYEHFINGKHGYVLNDQDYTAFSVPELLTISERSSAELASEVAVLTKRIDRLHYAAHAFVGGGLEAVEKLLEVDSCGLGDATFGRRLTLLWSVMETELCHACWNVERDMEDTMDYFYQHNLWTSHPETVEPSGAASPDADPQVTQQPQP